MSVIVPPEAQIALSTYRQVKDILNYDDPSGIHVENPPDIPNDVRTTQAAFLAALREWVTQSVASGKF
jgi:hypothetical protein